jgi:hypothetical protein
MPFLFGATRPARKEKNPHKGSESAIVLREETPLLFREVAQWPAISFT